MIAALLGSAFDGEEGVEAGRLPGAASAEDGVQLLSEVEAWDVLDDIPNDSAAALGPTRTPLGGAAA